MNLVQTFNGANSFNSDISNWDVSNVNQFSNTFSGTDSLTNCNKLSIYNSWNSQQSDLMNTEYSSWSTLDCTRCNSNEYVSSNNCEPCPIGTTNDAGDDVMGPDTTCSCWIESKDILWIFVNDWIVDPNPSRHVCGQIDTWDVSRVTDMSYLFCALQESWAPFECDSNRHSFNADLSGWDVSKVTSLEGIFMGTTSFDLTHITQWNMSQVRIFDKDLFTYLNPRHDVCTERNIRLSAKDGVRF